MKKVKFFLVALLTIVLGATSFAQMTDHSKMTASKPESFKVSGNCGMCKTRIEKAAKIPGVTKADWSSETKLLTLVYDPSKVKSEDVLKKVAAAGHDTEKFKADDKSYKSLPGCCKYR